LRKAAEEAAQTGGSGAGTVTVSMGRVGVAAVLPEAVARFRRQFPLARLRIVEGYSTPMLADLRNASLDFALFQ
jgi:LysR family transcriptional regulator, regulator of abg operon